MSEDHKHRVVGVTLSDIIASLCQMRLMDSPPHAALFQSLPMKQADGLKKIILDSILAL